MHKSHSTLIALAVGFIGTSIGCSPPVRLIAEASPENITTKTSVDTSSIEDVGKMITALQGSAENGKYEPWPTQERTKKRA